jgi:carbonic anhydrase/acetyltransferase-like protein (isoleucine patch superfamily)
MDRTEITAWLLTRREVIPGESGLSISSSRHACETLHTEGRQGMGATAADSHSGCTLACSLPSVQTAPSANRHLDPMPLSAYLDTFPSLGEQTYVHASAQLIGDVHIGDETSIWCNAVLRGDVNRIVIGHHSNFQDLSMGHVAHKHAGKPDGSPLVIGDYVTIGHSVILHGCTIGDECLIGMGSIVMDDAVVEPRVMLGAGSLVSPGKVLESGHLYIGRPAVKVRPLNAKEFAFLRYSAEHYVRVKNNYLATPAR